MERRDAMLAGALLMCFVTQVWSQLCSGTCQCPWSVPRCATGVPLVLDGCRCCQVCARQEGEACTDTLPCDSLRGLLCDYSASFPGGPGECVSQNALGCEVNGMRLEEGQTFQPSCAQLCHCLGGGVTCVPLCVNDLQVPAANCPYPHLVRLPGRCCKEWVCDGLDNSISPEALAVERPVERVEKMLRQDTGGGLPVQPLGLTSNCIEQTTDWSPCSHSCGPGVSTRNSNKNWACRPQSEARLCQIRPCQQSEARPCQIRPCQQSEARPCQTRPCQQPLLLVARRPQPGSRACESSYRSPVPIRLEHQGCWSVRVYQPRFCKASCPEGRCCSPHRTRTTRVAFRCPKGKFAQQQVMVIESCSCSSFNCPQAGATGPRRPLPWSSAM